MARWSFRPSRWVIVGTVFGCALTLSLGFWQIQRGFDKQHLQDRYSAAGTQAPLRLSADSAGIAGEVRNAEAEGRYLDERQLLLDNQTHQRQPGYDVWTPLRLSNGGVIIVNRGWVAGAGLNAREAEKQLPAPEGDVRVQGLWRSLPQPGMRLEPAPCQAAPAFPAIVNYPDADELACVLGETVTAGVLLLDPREPGGYVREWQQVSEFPPQRHYAYAAQWFAFAATLAAIFLKLNLKRIHD